MQSQAEAPQKKDATMLTIVFAVLFIVFVFSADLLSSYLRSYICLQTVACLLAARLGRERSIGFSKAFFISFFLTPIIGFILIFNSPKLKDEEYKEKMLERAAASAPALSIAEELTKLNELRKEGVITDYEFAFQKDKLLNS